MDTSDPLITFDEKGICNHCIDYRNTVLRHLSDTEKSKKAFQRLIERIKEEGKGKEYDCVIGLSGGADSTYVAYLVTKEFGLRPLAVHLDNGWDSREAVINIRNIVNRLEIDLYTHVIDWEEFRDLQRSYFKASVIDIEALTDHAILALLYSSANKHAVKYILTGSNMWTERIIPKSWAFNKNDLTNIKAIHKRFGRVPLVTFPQLGLRKLLYYSRIKKIQSFAPLNFINFSKDQVKLTIQQELGWKDYGSKHHESVFTRFYQGYILPRKFGIDKRRAHLSCLINAGQMTRNQALSILSSPTYDPDLQRRDYEFVIKKLGFTHEEFENYMKRPPVSHFAYKTDLWSKLDRKLMLQGSRLRQNGLFFYYRIFS